MSKFKNLGINYIRLTFFIMTLLLILVCSSSVILAEEPPPSDTEEIWFEVLPTYIVTFSETNNQEDVSIQVYTDASRTEQVGETLSTDSTGIASLNLGAGEYWFRAQRSGFENFLGAFIVVDADKTVNFTMIESTTPPPPPPPPPPPSYELTIAVEGEGTVTPYVGTQSHPEGTEIDLVAIPAEGWQFKRWSGDIIGTAHEIQVTLMDDMALTAHFVEEDVSEIDRATVVIDPEKGGSLGVNGMIQVTLPSKATSKKSNLTIIVYDSDLDEELQQIIGDRIQIGNRVFRVTVTDEDGKPIRRFSQPLTLAFNYDPNTVTEEQLQNLMIHYYDEDLQTWIPLPTTVDPQRRTITCQTSHLTLFTLLEADRLTDIQGHWGEADILKLQAIGAISGYPDSTFRPENMVNREQFARMLVDTAGIEVPRIARLLPFIFADADAISGWAQPYVEAAVTYGLIEGYEDRTFRPKERVTRIQVAVMLSRALGLIPSGTPDFLDADDIPSWGVGHVAALAERDIIQGIPSQIEPGFVFDPSRAATRSQSAAFLSRYLSARLGR